MADKYQTLHLYWYKQCLYALCLIGTLLPAMELPLNSAESSDITLTIINNSGQDYTVSKDVTTYDPITQVHKKSEKEISLKNLFHTDTFAQADSKELSLNFTSNDHEKARMNGIFLTQFKPNLAEQIFSASLLQGDPKTKNAELSFNPALDNPNINVIVQLNDTNAKLNINSTPGVSIIKTRNYKQQEIFYPLTIMLENLTSKLYAVFFKEDTQKTDLKTVKPNDLIKINLNKYFKNSGCSNNVLTTLYIKEKEAAKKSNKKWIINFSSKTERTGSGLNEQFMLTINNNFDSQIIKKLFSFAIFPNMASVNIHCLITDDPKNSIQIKPIFESIKKETL